ncbi:cyclic nucleotide-gated ion channel 1-like [Humulus lupulus]|uniref:cyclic nucleotide-gated ion channel 1-like n=1 Tax=Humulus lupulus TaxID=3486 RepID=UPI002B40CDE8|nr:cyclic nucleotide-gated ion channel 1-like [Humulus lupulus]XP_062120206.1 cyclic nucleotide-gated ion channel 1-like [Humulus lupulus]XP_062120207.1 cyclic nucleotide-gated ion channel 1-like [Humulus lupulus]
MANRNESTSIKMESEKEEEDSSELKMENYKQLMLNKMFLIAHMAAIVNDPFFYYIPILNLEHKCLRMDPVLKIVVPGFRIVLDSFYIFRLFYLKSRNNGISDDWTSSNKSDIAIVISAIIPLPQVIIFSLFPKVSCMANWNRYMGFLDLFLLLQYVPRIIPIYKSCVELNWSYDSMADRVFIKGALNFFLFIAASHITGAFWYFFSIQRLKACWLEYACGKNHQGYASFTCDRNYSKSDQILSPVNNVCPTNSSQEDTKFGIFNSAITSNLVGITNDFPRKYMLSFWWGLRHLSSYGQNLETSSYVWEAIFAILISIVGLLLVLYLIGNLQTYMQLDIPRTNDIKQKLKKREGEIYDMTKNNDYKSTVKQSIRKNLRKILTEQEDLEHLNDLIDLLKDFFADNPNAKQSELEEKFVEWEKSISDGKIFQEGKKRKSVRKWMRDNNTIPKEIRLRVKERVICRLADEVEDVNIVSVLRVLNGSQEEFLLKKHLCESILRKFDKLEDVMEKAIELLKPVIYEENENIISKGEPLDLMCFITQGVVWCDDGTSGAVQPAQNQANDSNTSASSIVVRPIEIEGGQDHYGKELLDWQLNNKSIDEEDFPMAKCNIKCHTVVEAFVLKAIDLQTLFPGTKKVFSKTSSTVSSKPRWIGQPYMKVDK